MNVFAGPNGCGKSTITGQTDFEGKDRLLDPDAIARSFNPSDPERAAVAAGRDVIRRSREYLQTRESFAIETTFSGSWVIDVIRTALIRGFFVRVLYVCVRDPEMSVQRVRERVAKGGHTVPEADIRRRYARSLTNMRSILPIVPQVLVFDNSHTAIILVLEAQFGSVRFERVERFPWARMLIE